MSVSIEVRNLQRRFPLNTSCLNRITRKILSSLGVRQGQVSLAFVTNQKIRVLNKRFLKRDYATDVLAFGSGAGRGPAGKSPAGIRGEIVISADMAKTNAGRYRVSFQREIVLYVIHGILHLLGYDDHGQIQCRRMRKKEQDMLRLFP